MSSRKNTEFTSALTKREAAAVLLYFPVHILILPQLLGYMIAKGIMAEAPANLLMYAVGAGYMLIAGWRFLRRDFDPLMDNFMYCVLQVCICYGLMIVMNMAVNGVLINLDFIENPNNEAIIGAAAEDYGKMAALAVFLAPLVEEMLFRAGIFGLIRRKNRTAAYVVSILAFSVYHVWPYTIGQPMNWIYIVQYIPASFMLCRCYEKCSSIWGSIFMHMAVNGISLHAMRLLQELM